MVTWDDETLQPLHRVDAEPIIVLRPTLGLTAYLAEPDRWAAGGAQAALRFFADRVDEGAMPFYATSLMTEWDLAEHAGGIEQLAENLHSEYLALDRPRHNFNLRVADYPNTPSIGFEYTEVDPARGDRAAVIELTLPPKSDPAELLQLALELASLGPVCSMVGGYAVRFHPGEVRDGHAEFHTWALRFLGLDARLAEWAWHAPESMVGTGWLTFVGRDLADRHDLDLDGLAATSFTEDVVAFPTQEGLLLRAGEEPTVGDLNDLDFPEAYAEVARALAPLALDAFEPLYGPFAHEDTMDRWARRLLDPEAWARP